MLSRVQLFSTPWNSPGQNTGVGSLSLLQGIFPTQGLSPGLHCRWTLYQLNHTFSYSFKVLHELKGIYNVTNIIFQFLCFYLSVNIVLKSSICSSLPQNHDLQGWISSKRNARGNCHTSFLFSSELVYCPKQRLVYEKANPQELPCVHSYLVE